MSKAKQYAELQRQENAIYAQINALRTKLDAIHLERVILGDELRVKIEDGGVYRKPGVDQTLTIKREGRDWKVYDENGLQKVYDYSDEAARDLGIWGAIKVA